MSTNAQSVLKLSQRKKSKSPPPIAPPTSTAERVVPTVLPRDSRITRGERPRDTETDRDLTRASKAGRTDEVVGGFGLPLGLQGKHTQRSGRSLPAPPSLNTPPPALTRHIMAGSLKGERGPPMQRSSLVTSPILSFPPPPSAFQGPDDPTLASPAAPLPPPPAVGAPSGDIPAAPASAEAPRRRLVRGANAKTTPVLPEYQAALDALGDLDRFLDCCESADGALAAVAHDRAVSTTRSGGTTSRRPRRASAAEIAALGTLFGLVPEPGKEEGQPGAELPTLPSASAPSSSTNFQYVYGGTGLGLARIAVCVSVRAFVCVRSSDHVVKASQCQSGCRDASETLGVFMPASDVTLTTSPQRQAILSRVKAGEMSVNDALSQVRCCQCLFVTDSLVKGRRPCV